MDSGPYAFVRHPGYAGSLAVTLGAPVLLDSLPGFWLATVTALLTVLRTYLEDQMLKRELAGYEGYSQRVRHRLLPLVW